jgi:uncharacterized protein
MIELPDGATFAAVLADRRLVLAIVIALLSAGVRGFSGFGSALIYVPLMSAVHRASGQTYRRVAYVIMKIATFVSMPIFDGWLR